MGMFGNSAGGSGKAERPIVLKSQNGQVELGAPDSRGRYTVKVTDNHGNVEYHKTVNHDRYQFAQDIAREYGAEGGTLRRRP